MKKEQFEQVVHASSRLCQGYDDNVGNIMLLRGLGFLWREVDRLELTHAEWKILQDARDAR